MASLRQTSTQIAPALRGGRRHLALHLPRWATDCRKRADPALAASPRPRGTAEVGLRRFAHAVAGLYARHDFHTFAPAGPGSGDWS